MIKTFRLSNGIKVVTERMQGIKSVAFGVWIKTGSAYENCENNGIAHLIEHMLFKGTGNYDAKELADMMTMIGGNLNAFTAKECTSFYCRTLDTHLETAIGIIGDMITNSLLDPKDITKEKRVILDEIDMYDDSPEDMVHELLQKRIWDKHSLGYIISGSRKNVKSFKQKDIIKFMQENYYASNMIISIAGSFEDEKVVCQLEKAFGSIPDRANTRKISKPVYNKCFVKKHKDIEQVHINMAFDSIGYDVDDRYSLSVANAVLGGSLNSRLFQHIREELGLTYSIYSYESLYSNAGLFHIYAAMNPSQVNYVISEIEECIDIFKDKGITEEELEKTKSQLITEYILGLESTNFRMENNARTIMLYDSVETFEDVTGNINSVTTESVKEYLDTYIDIGNSSLCIIGNMNDVDVSKYMNR